MLLTVLWCIATAIAVGASIWGWQARSAKARYSTLSTRMRVVEQSLRQCARQHIRFLVYLDRRCIESSGSRVAAN